MNPADRQLASRLGRHAACQRPRPSPAEIADLRRRAYAHGFALIDLGELDASNPRLGMQLRAYVTDQINRRR